MDNLLKELELKQRLGYYKRESYTKERFAKIYPDELPKGVTKISVADTTYGAFGATDTEDVFTPIYPESLSFQEYLTVKQIEILTKIKGIMKFFVVLTIAGLAFYFLEPVISSFIQ